MAAARILFKQPLSASIATGTKPICRHPSPHTFVLGVGQRRLIGGENSNVGAPITFCNDPSHKSRKRVWWAIVGFGMGLGLLFGGAGIFLVGIGVGNHLSNHRWMSSSSTNDGLKNANFLYGYDNIHHCRDEIVAIVGKNAISDSEAELKSHSSTEWSPYEAKKSIFGTTTDPKFIVYPQDTLQVSQVMKVCYKWRIPVTAFSGGTSLDGALAPTRGGIFIDFSRMNRVLRFNERDLDVVVQPGVGWESLNQFLEGYDLFFPPDPGAGAQIGGMIATGCSGTNAYRYGTMKDWVISMTVVLADGTIVETRKRPRKSTAGYDLTRLMVGSSGTLGLVTEATLKLTAKPENEHVVVAAFPSTGNAVNAVIDMVQKGLPLAAIELLDANTVKAVNKGGYSSKQYKETPTLFLKFSGTQQTVNDQIAMVEGLSRMYSGDSVEVSGDPEKVGELWAARKTALFSLLAQKKNPNDSFISSDVAVPLSRLAEIIDEIQRKVADKGLKGAVVGHVGDGNFHASIVHSKKEKEAAENLTRDLQRRAVEMEGTVTGEHGIGLTLRDALEVEVGKEGVDMMRKIKMALDPFCLLNCGKIMKMDKVDYRS